MQLYLIRHGETVDNIAGVYAGVKDSQLTNYGVEQTKKLGDYLAASGVVFTHIFASPLIRAYRTAKAIRDAQLTKCSQAASIVEVQDLIEQDFGYYEGKPFHARSSPATSGQVPEAVGIESKEAMSVRAENFLASYLYPVVDAEMEPVIAIVSHGMLLSTLWRRILLKIPRRALSIAPEVTAARGSVILEHLGGWSNTGYLHLALQKHESAYNMSTNAKPVQDISTKAEPVQDISAQAEPIQDTSTKAEPVQDISTHAESVQDTSAHAEPVQDMSTKAEAVQDIPTKAEPIQDASTAAQRILDISPGTRPVQHRSAATAEPPKHECTTITPRTDFTGFTVSIIAIDSKTHLIGVKRQRGGIGRLAHDESQQKLTSFFKKPRTS